MSTAWVREGNPPFGIEELAYVAEAGAKVGEFADYLEFVLVVRQVGANPSVGREVERIAGARSRLRGWPLPFGKLRRGAG